MKTNTSVTIRLNNEVKQQAQHVFAALGLDMTAAINIFLRQAIQCNGLPFKVVIRRDIPNKATMQAIGDAEHNRSVFGPYRNVAELEKALNA